MHATIYFICVVIKKKKKERIKKGKRGPRAYKCMFSVCYKHSETQLKSVIATTLAEQQAE
jgi:hypothetical protein